MPVHCIVSKCYLTSTSFHLSNILTCRSGITVLQARRESEADLGPKEGVTYRHGRWINPDKVIYTSHYIRFADAIKTRYKQMGPGSPSNPSITLCSFFRTFRNLIQINAIEEDKLLTGEKLH